MTTSWVNARNISQYAETGATDIHVRWIDENNFAGLRSSSGSPVTSEKELFHIARSPKPNITNKTYFLKLTNFNFSSIPTTITGIDCKIESRRFGRITDETINLIYNDQLLGNNQAQLSTNPLIYYGGENNLWGLSSLESNIVSSSTFGLLVRFKSHPNFPHSDGMHLISIQLRIH